MAQIFIDRFSTTLSADITSVTAALPLPSAEVTRIQQALFAGGIEPASAIPYDHFVPLFIDNGTSVEQVRVCEIVDASTVYMRRGASPITASAGDAVYCSVPADGAGMLAQPFGVSTTNPMMLTPGAHQVFNNTDTAIWVYVQGVISSSQSVDILNSGRLESVVEVQNTNGTSRTVSFFDQTGAALSVLWAGGVDMSSMAASVKVGVYRLRLIYPTASRSSTASAIVEAVHYS